MTRLQPKFVYWLSWLMSLNSDCNPVMCHLINFDLKGKDLDNFLLKTVNLVGVINTELWRFHDNYRIISKISSSNTDASDVCFRFRMKNDSRKLKIFFRNFKPQKELAACLLLMRSCLLLFHSLTHVHTHTLFLYSIWQLLRRVLICRLQLNWCSVEL